MLIRDQSKMEKAMSITYEDMQKALESYRDESFSRNSFLLENVRKLVMEYAKSLNTPNDVVKVGFVDGGEVEIVPIGMLQADSDHVLRFRVITGIDGPGFDRYWHAIAVSIWVENAYVHVTVGGSSRAIKIARGEPEGCYHEVCAAIKQQIMDAISSKMPK